MLTHMRWVALKTVCDIAAFVRPINTFNVRQVSTDVVLEEPCPSTTRKGGCEVYLNQWKRSFAGAITQELHFRATKIKAC